MNTKFLRACRLAAAAGALLLFSVLFPGCYYYKVNTLNEVNSAVMRSFDSAGKYLILHQGNKAWHLENLRVDEKTFAGVLANLPRNQTNYMTTKVNHKNRYIKDFQTNQTYYLKQVQLYYTDTLIRFSEGDSVMLTYSSINKAEIYVKDKTNTNASFAVPIVLGTIIGAAMVTGVVILLTKSSCPLVYTLNNNQYAFAGEIFGGAVYSSLERHDYLPLPGFRPENRRYRLKITNALPEVQYINLAELWVVSHTPAISVLPDRQGRICTLSAPVPPSEAWSSAHADLLPEVREKDGTAVLFDEPPSATGDTNGFNSLCLTFRVPADADTGKLVIRAGNSMWGDFTYGEFTRLFGTRYSTWIRKQADVPASVNIAWMKEQRFVLMVYTETAAGWQFADYFDLIGPLGARDLVMPISLGNRAPSGGPGETREIRVKIESGYNFWELDYAGLDCSEDQPVILSRLSPSKAVTESGKEVKAQLTGDDSRYYVQKEIGEEGTIKYSWSTDLPGMVNSVFLHTKGYYEHVRDYRNPPDRQALESFRTPGRLSHFSYDLHEEFIRRNCVFATEQNVP